MKFSRYNITSRSGETIFLTNLLSRTILELSPEAYKTFLTFSGSNVDGYGSSDLSDFRRALQDGFFLVEDDFDELQYTRYLVQKARFNHRELKLVIAPTMGCNFSCHYCFEEKHSSVLSPESQLKILQIVSEKIPGREALGVQWFGGEPLQAFSVIQSLSNGLLKIADAANANYAATIVTNGFLLTGNIAKSLQDLGVKNAQITLDGDQKLHDKTRRDLLTDNSSYKTILDNLVEASEYLSIRIRIHVAPFSVPNVFNLIQELAQTRVSKRATEIYFAPLFKYLPLRSQDQFSFDNKRFFTAEQFAKIETMLYQETAKLGFPMPELFDTQFGVCTAVQDNTLVFDSNGDIFKCYFDLGIPENAIGSVLNGVRPSSILSTWMDHEIARDEECQDCAFLPVCFGGCSKKWHTGAPKETICTPLRFNAQDLIPLFANQPTRNLDQNCIS